MIHREPCACYERVRCKMSLFFRLFVVNRTTQSQTSQEFHVPFSVSRQLRSRRWPWWSTFVDAPTPTGGLVATRRATTMRTRCDAGCGTPSRRARDWRPPSTPDTPVRPPKTSVRRRRRTSLLAAVNCWPTSTRSAVRRSSESLTLKLEKIFLQK